MSEEPSFDSKEVGILPSDRNIVEYDASKTRPRTLKSEGREYQCELRKRSALANDRDLRAKTRSLEEFICDCKNADEIRREIADMAKEVDHVQKSFDEWIEVSLDTSESQRATEIKKLEDDVKSVFSRRSLRSRTSATLGSSRSSCRDTSYLLR